MPLIRMLRAMFPWYAVLGTGAFLFVLTEWLGGRFMGAPAQSICGAASGGIAALGVLMYLHKRYHPTDVWRPARGYDFSKAAKIAGTLAGMAGVADTTARSSHWRYWWVTLALAALLAAAAAALARMAKSNPAEESPSCKL